jgi:hypothetical protein
VPFERIAQRYERISAAITANQHPLNLGGAVPGAAMTLAAVDRLVHHAVILKMNVEGSRRLAARPGRTRTGRRRRRKERSEGSNSQTAPVTPAKIL